MFPQFQIASILIGALDWPRNSVHTEDVAHACFMLAINGKVDPEWLSQCGSGIVSLRISRSAGSIESMGRQIFRGRDTCGGSWELGFGIGPEH